MGDLSTHFSRHEFSCHCGCGQDTVDVELITVLEQVRTEFNGATITINSGNRCESYNKKIGGRPHSFHLISKAADIVIKGVDPARVHDRIDAMFPGRFGLGMYKTFTHIDVRAKKARWVG